MYYRFGPTPKKQFTVTDTERRTHSYMKKQMNLEENHVLIFAELLCGYDKEILSMLVNLLSKVSCIYWEIEKTLVKIKQN